MSLDIYNQDIAKSNEEKRMIDKTTIPQQDMGYANLIDAMAIQAARDYKSARSQCDMRFNKLHKMGVINRILRGYTEGGGVH